MKPKELEKKITLGFKILSGYYQGGISREDVSMLGDSDSIQWGTKELENTFNSVGMEIRKNDIFKYWESWNISLREAMSEAIALNFLLLLTKDWERKGKPFNPTSSQHKAFQKNAIILLDRSIYEYVTKQWRGSSDSKIANNLEDLERSGSDLFDPVSSQSWNNLIDEMIEKGTIDGDSYVDKLDNKRVKLILYYYYILNSVDGPTDPTLSGIDLDHIIPKSLFDTTPREDLVEYCNNIINLALLPKKQNISKSDKKLNQINENWLKTQITKYEEIFEPDYSKYSEVTQIEDLKDYRGKKIKETFNIRRKRLVEN